MTYEEFYQAVVLAHINSDPNNQKFGKEVVAILFQFRKEKQAAQQSSQLTGCTCGTEIGLHVKGCALWRDLVVSMQPATAQSV